MSNDYNVFVVIYKSSPLIRVLKYCVNLMSIQVMAQGELG